MLEDFKKRVAEGRTTVCVLGLGYVGLPLAAAFAEAGLLVVGYDVDRTKVINVLAGKSGLRHFEGDEYMPHIVSGSLRVTDNLAEIEGCDAYVICVPTPLDDARSPDLRCVMSAVDTVGVSMRRGCLVALESTTYPGTTSEVVRERLERRSCLVAGDDFFLVYTPERQDPGNPVYKTRNIPKVVGGVTPQCLDAGMTLYGRVMEECVPVSTTDAAEMVKIFENVYRAVNIALVNEMKVLCHRLGIDVWEVVRAAGSKPFGFQPFYPGPGLGGHCIPIDPFYLSWRARQIGMSTRFIELAGEINASMPEYVVRRAQDALDAHGLCMTGAGVLVLGVAYKPDVSDVRESPAVKVIKMLEEKGADIWYHDPHVPELGDMRSIQLTPSVVASADCVLLVTDHEQIDYGMVAEHAVLIVDARGRFFSERVSGEVVQA